MSSGDDREKPVTRGGRSGSASSIGKELGSDLDFEADALLDSLLSERPPGVAAGASGERPSAPEPPPPPPPPPARLPAEDEGDDDASTRVLHAPESRQYPDDEVTWVGDVDTNQLEALRAQAQLLPPPGVVAPPALAPLPPPPAIAPPRPGNVLRPTTSTVPRPASVSRSVGPASVRQPSSLSAPFEPAKTLPQPPRAPGPPQPPAVAPAAVTPPVRDVSSFSLDDDEVTRVHGLATLEDIDGMLERAAQAPPPSAHEPEPSSSAAALGNLSELSFEEPDDGAFDELLASNYDTLSPPTVAARASEIEALAASEVEELALADRTLAVRDDELESLIEDSQHSQVPRAPLSHFPPPPDLRDSPSLWPDERPAAAHLGSELEEWRQRAEWLENEARGGSDPLAKARTLLVASELWALTGDIQRAREVATEANSMARSLTLSGRQLRALAASEGDWKAVATALDLETRGAPTPEARVHAAYLNAELHRLVLNDDATSKKKLELAVRASSEDPRAHLAKLVDLLAKGTGPARMRWPENATLDDLLSASEESARLRGAPAAPESTVSPSLALEQARRALGSGDRAAAATLVARLSEIEGIGPAALWLAAALAAHEPHTRSEAIGWLERLLGGPADSQARRALAARALEQGSAEGVRAASDGESEAFAALDRAVLGALSGEGIETLGPIAQELARDPAQAPLATALQSAVSLEPDGAALPGSTLPRAEQALGSALAQSEPSNDAVLGSLRAKAAHLLELSPGSVLGQSFALAFALRERDSARLVELLPALSPGNAEHAAELNLASALCQELSGAGEAARARYAAALESDPRAPAPLRALLQHADRDATLRLLSTAAESANEPLQTALYLLEAALRLGPEDAERYDELLRSAASACPSLSLVYRLGEQQARTRGDTEKLLGWLRARRSEADDELETALDLVREALLVAESDMPLAASLLGDALASRPGDVALRELHERIAGSGEEERANWREEVAGQVAEGTRRDLLLQAALERYRAGQIELAVRSGEAALALGAGDLVRVLVEECAPGTPAAARLSEALIAQARASDDTGELCELYTRLSKLDRARGDHSSALLWQSAILERSPDHLPALRRIEHHYIGANRLDELEPIAARLAALTEGAEADAHARLCARIRIRIGAWSNVHELVSGVLAQERPRLWALRMLEAQARVADEPEVTLAVTQALQERVDRPVDKATLLLRGAEAAARLGRLEQAQLLLERALTHVPDHPVVLTTLAEVLEERGDFRAAARALDALASASAVDAHKVSAWHQAAVLWLDKASDTERGKGALEKAVGLDIRNEDAVVRLQALYVQLGERENLAELLERRLAHTTDPEERVALEVTRGRALADVGERAQAKAALAAALDANPDHLEALEAFADLCVAEEDFSAAEQAYIRLVRHVPEPARQAQIYRRLANLYDNQLPNAERAELAYREVLKRDPQDADAVSRLSHVFSRRGTPEKAVELHTEFVSRATTPEEKRERTLALAFVIEELTGDRKRAEALLDKLRKEAPLDPKVLRGLVELHQRAGEQRAATLLLERAASDARRALATGRFDPALFEMLSAVAELKGHGDAATLAMSTLLALSGEDLPVSPTGQAAGDARLDDQLAPELLSPALRALLRKAGGVLDAAYKLDLRAMKAAPLPVASGAFVAFVQNVAQSFGIRGLEVLASPAIGPVCLPISSDPPQLVFGQALLDHSDDAARFFLLMRCLKILQGRTAALARTPPIELPIVMSAFLSLFASNWSPQGVDAKKLADAQQRISRAMVMRLDDDVPVLALEVMGHLGNRMSLLGTALAQWGNRTGLLAVGSLNAALRGLSFVAGQIGGPPAGPERVKWVIRNPEARDLAVFSVSEAYADARARLGTPRS